VVGITGGDTITVMRNNREISIRLYGINPPLVGAGGIASQLRSSLVSYPKKEKQAVGEKD
jgi:endonuclease YncB( thermonuclease family)